ncbi:MAG TPA: alpha-amylase family protein [Labilithrix sp.]|jgi:hypothetical protein
MRGLPGCYTTKGTDDGVCNTEEAPDVRLPPSDWIRGARVAGLAAFADITVCDVGPAMDQLQAERVSVVEVDGDLSSYLDEAGFVEQLRVLHLCAREAHKRGMRCIAYYPVLESLTPDVATTPHSMFKDHPDWVQVGMDGKSNYFIGGGGRVFWVDPGEESAWCCPTSGYADYYIDRVQRLAGTALDGLWGDVPLLSDIVGVWPCVNATCNAKFKADTGLDAPTMANWNDPVFVRWITWRHQLIWDLEQRILAGAKQIRQDFEIVIETVTMDYTSGTVQGLDGAHADDGQIHRVWEIDAVSDATGMRNAAKDDWYSMVAMMKYARGSSKPRPSWVFCYGLQPDDAERVMSLCLTTGNSPYETQIPQINTSCGSPYRKKMYGWLERHPQILLSESANETAVIFSSFSRDILDQAKGVGLYTQTNMADTLWWTTEDEDSAKETQYIADWRGFNEFLVQNHVPFDVVTTPHMDDQTLARYRTIVAPSPASLGDDAINRIYNWVNNGGQLIFTGTEAGAWDEAGLARTQPLLMQKLGIDPATTDADWNVLTIGMGSVRHYPPRAGALFFNGDSSGCEPLEDAFQDQIDIDGPPDLLVEVRNADTGEFVVVFGNMVGLGADEQVGVFAPKDIGFNCTLNLGMRQVAQVVLTAPNDDPTKEDQIVPFSVTPDGRIAFGVALHAIAAAIVSFK